MDNEIIIGLVIISAIFIVGIIFFVKYLSKRRKQKAEAEAERIRIENDKKEKRRQKLYDFFQTKIKDIRNGTDQFKRHLDIETGYFSNYQLTIWKNKYERLFNEIRHIKGYERIGLDSKDVGCIKLLIDFFTYDDIQRTDFNKKFVKEELNNYRTFFDNIETRKLDIQQRTAIVTDEDNNIVIAGAGSGKTTTIVGKINYIIDRYKVKPEKILLISFTDKSAEELRKRIKIEGVQAKTFHKFGIDLISFEEGKKPSIFNKDQFKPDLTKYFKELILDEKYLKKVTKYFINFLRQEKSQFDFTNQGEYIQYLKDQNYRPYKEIQPQGLQTFHREIVKSIEECKIANFLLFNNVTYKYEFPYEHDTATPLHSRWKPDFTITQNGKTVYLEHFAVRRNNDVPPFFAKSGETYQQAKDKYWAKINWARETNRQYGTTLVETYSYEMHEGILYDNLKRKLEEQGIIFRLKTPEEIWQIINETAKDEVKNFIELFGTFITLMKSNNYSIEDVINRNKQTKDEFLKKRNALFMEIITPIYERYQTNLFDRKEIDFSDMINKASKYIANGKYKDKFSYVVIDEFQDISVGRHQLVKAIKTNNPSCKLFCVGDDWQSIYRFSGSDISLFKEFEKYFGFTVKSKIETTYRFHKPLINLSSDFIQKNPNQAKKVLQGASNSRNTKFKIQYSVNQNQDDTDALQNIFDELFITDNNIENKEIFILGRYGFDINRIKNESGIFRIDKENETIGYSIKTEEGETKKIKSQFMTVHKAKGLEADIIIILNCNAGKYGFPSEMSDDQILNLLLSEADQFENGEERRLFYVAMTRAKENVYFVADSSFKSKFIKELEVESGQAPNKKCPNCITSDIVLRKTGIANNGNKYQFYGCTNFLYGCEYTKMEWIN